MASLPKSRVSLLAVTAAAALLLWLGTLRGATTRLIGDEGTYAAMAASLARDGDLRFESADAEWARTRSERPAGVILQQTASGIAYSKPILYALLAAPFSALAGEAGLVLFNLVLLVAALALARAALAHREGGARALETLLCFAAASVVAPHLAWRTSETLQLALALGGLALTLGGELGGNRVSETRVSGTRVSGAGRSRLAGRPARLGGFCAPSRIGGAALLGLLVALREPNALVAAVPVVVALGARRWRVALETTLVAAVAYAAVVGATVALAGAPNPYKTARSTFDAETGYPAGPDGAAALARFGRMSNLATSDLGPVPQVDATSSAYAAIYFFVGRHAGLVAYLPLAVVLLAAALRRTREPGRPRLDRVGRAALAGFVATALFYLVWWPENYFGGSTHLGNRYLLAAYPCLLFVPRVLPSRRTLAAVWGVALAFAVSTLLSVTRTAALDPTSQSHTHAGLFRLLPYESVASAIDGRRDRYWAGDFLRFVDPFARADATSFELAAGAPAAEVEIATVWAGTPLALLVVASSPEATLEIRDWLGGERHRLTADATGRSGGVVRFEPSRAWRAHRFWWSGGHVARARFVRFRLLAPPGATARLRYLGRTRVPESGFDAELAQPLELPSVVSAGQRLALAVDLKNTGAWRWSSSESLPVLVGARWQALDGATPESEARATLDRAAGPGARATARLELEAPQVPGRYRLTVDLVMEDVAWFAERVGRPLAEAVVTVSE